MPPQRPRTWREFEKLVASIEKALAVEGVQIKSPDRIPSKVTGKKREVDATLRYKVGSASVLITVECRKRKDKQDVTWIEQLAKKRELVQASKTIAVSSSPFTPEAIAVAKDCDIELREMKDVTEEIIKSWIEDNKAPLVSIFPHLQYRLDSFGFWDEHGNSPQIHPEVATAFFANKLDAEIAHSTGGKPLSCRYLLHYILDRPEAHKYLESIPDNKPTPSILEGKPDVPVFVRTTTGKARMHKFHLSVIIEKVVGRTMPMQLVEELNYEGPDGTLAKYQTVSFSHPLMGTLELSFIENPNDKEKPENAEGTPDQEAEDHF